MDVAAVSSTAATCPTIMRVPAYAGRIDETHLVTVIILLTSFSTGALDRRGGRSPLLLSSSRLRDGGLRGEAAAMVQDGEAFDAMASPCFLSDGVYDICCAIVIGVEEDGRHGKQYNVTRRMDPIEDEIMKATASYFWDPKLHVFRVGCETGGAAVDGRGMMDDKKGEGPEGGEVVNPRARVPSVRRWSESVSLTVGKAVRTGKRAEALVLPVGGGEEEERRARREGK
ncbi:hypothetical protein L249_1596, partial [Ophiocordyceps polyrhachis-furcata BCC 54312]